MGKQTIIWQITDGKRGHENQSAGLIGALSRRQAIEVVQVGIDANRASWRQALLGNFPAKNHLPHPDLIVGTGSQTHSTLLAAGRATGTPTIVIMAPPRGLTRFFDLCIIPQHDDRSGRNIVTTLGAMNLIRPSQSKEADAGLFLIGGPSQHHGWDERGLLQQIETILATESSTHWTLTTSRRTPGSTARALSAIQNPRLTVVPVEETSPCWLPEQLAPASLVWASEDSVSMVYEALSAGAKVGVLPVPRKSSNSRVIRGLDRLIEDGFLLPYDRKQTNLKLFQNPPALNEAERMAKIVAERFL